MFMECSTQTSLILRKCFISDSSIFFDFLAWSSSKKKKGFQYWNAKVIYKIKNEKKRKIVESAVINSVKNVNISDGFYNFDSLTSKYVIEAANLQKTVKDLNELISSHGDITWWFYGVFSVLFTF